MKRYNQLQEVQVICEKVSKGITASLLQTVKVNELPKEAKAEISKLSIQFKNSLADDLFQFNVMAEEICNRYKAIAEEEDEDENFVSSEKTKSQPQPKNVESKEITDLRKEIEFLKKQIKNNAPKPEPKSEPKSDNDLKEVVTNVVKEMFNDQPELQDAVSIFARLLTGDKEAYKEMKDIESKMKIEIEEEVHEEEKPKPRGRKTKPDPVEGLDDLAKAK